ncbi:TolC family protein [Asticcacaulis benevestitus]|uniref:TolC family protein n=1 Tax=Asticcacaulis benevestitus TaxID=347481 RepID=UPI00068852B1|nr:TolC family protein [Asticcacaulis benevestitus]
MTFPKLRPGGAKTTALRVAGLSLAWAISALALQAETLPLSVAITRAATADPSLSAQGQRLLGAEGSLLQAGVKPNPRLDLQVENLLGSQPYGGIDRTETTLTYQQILERGDKRQARIGVARAERDLIVANGRIRSLDLMTEVQGLWIEAVVCEAEVGLAQDRLTLARQAQTEVTRRVKAARDPLFAGSLADSDVAQAQIAVDQARQKADAIKAQLAAYWNGPVDFDLDTAWLEDMSAAGATPTLMETPEIERLRVQQRIATAQVALETSKRAQDPTVEAGVRHFKADGAVAFVVGGSIPLGRYDTNQGAVVRSQAEAEAAATDIEMSERIRLREIAAISPRLVSYAEEVRRIDAEVIPQAQRAVTQVREGFARGGFSYRDVIGAQDALIGIKTRRLFVLKTFQLERARREHLAGQWVPLIPVQDAN